MQCQCGHPHRHHMWEQQPEPCLVPNCMCQAMNPYGEQPLTRKRYLQELRKLLKELFSLFRGR